MKEAQPKSNRKHVSARSFAKVSLIIWFICVLTVAGIISYQLVIRQELFDTAPDTFVYALIALILIGGFAFVLGAFSLAILLLNKAKPKQNPFVFLIKLFFVLGIFPIYLFLNALQPIRIIKKIKRSGIKGFFKALHLKPVLLRLAALVAVIAVVFPIWAGGYATVGVIGWEAIGYGTEAISVSGTGSMHPTFPKGEGTDPKELANQVVGTPGMLRYPNGLLIAGKRYFGHELGRGDIVGVENDKIREMTAQIHGNPSGWVKRVIGMPGDTIELREGIVYLNGEPQKEQYTAQPHSTFGETFLRECVTVTVPEDSIFVMGDNRKGSGDSREVGFIEIAAVNHVLPLKDQIDNLDHGWRDTANDLEATSKIKLDKEKYVQLLNEKRKEVGAKDLKYQPKLEDSSSKRAKTILEYDDFSFEATASGYTMSKAMRDANYSNIVYGEAPTQGYYDAKELIDYQFEFPESKKFFADKTYQEIGISEVEGEINGCPTQVIVQHVAGYVPPNYKQADIDSWKTTLSRLREIQPSWSRLKESSDFYEDHKGDVDRITEIIAIRISNISAIVSRMEANQWLTGAEERMIDQDLALFNEQEALANRLNE
jgi:signal peptidase I